MIGRAVKAEGAASVATEPRRRPVLPRARAPPRDTSRRGVLEGGLTLVGVALVESLFPALADPSLLTYEDPSGAFSVSYPTSWTTAEGQATEKENRADRTVVWFPKDTPPRDVNVTLLINNAGADFTKLGSLGTAEDFGTRVVNSMDRSFLLRKARFGKQTAASEVQTANLISAKSLGGMYSIEYVLKKPMEAPKRLLSLVALRFDGTYNRFFTLTAQCPDADYPKYSTEIQTVLDSFKPLGSRI